MITPSLQEFYDSLKINTAIMALDLGDKKLGIAISDMKWIMAMPFEVITSLNEKHKISHIIGVIQKHKICGIVVGLPLNMDGTESEQTKKTNLFAEKLSSKIELPLFMQDERMTSLAANSLLKSAGMNRKDRHQMDDQVAACLILESVISNMRSFS